MIIAWSHWRFDITASRVPAFAGQPLWPVTGSQNQSLEVAKISIPPQKGHEIAWRIGVALPHLIRSFD
jgi:hypothetical protein